MVNNENYYELKNYVFTILYSLVFFILHSKFIICISTIVAEIIYPYTQLPRIYAR